MINYEKLLKVTLCSNVEVLALTRDLCRRVIADGIPGDFAEAGCAHGAHGCVMSEEGQSRTTYLFDSFEGIPKHGPEDKEWTAHYGESESDQRVSGNITVCELSDVKETMRRYVRDIDNVVFIKGWFVDTLPAFHEPLAILRMDCDLYESYKVAFENLWPLLSPGGWLIIDDWNLSGCRQAFEEYFGSVPGHTLKSGIFYMQK